VRVSEGSKRAAPGDFVFKQSHGELLLHGGRPKRRTVLEVCKQRESHCRTDRRYLDDGHDKAETFDRPSAIRGAVADEPSCVVQPFVEEEIDGVFKSDTPG
jgi:hypothetical protein